CPDTRRSNKPCATTLSTHSVFPDFSSLPKLNPVEPPWYGPVCPVVGEGWHREVSPYPDQPWFCAYPSFENGGYLPIRERGLQQFHGDGDRQRRPDRQPQGDARRR